MLVLAIEPQETTVRISVPPSAEWTEIDVAVSQVCSNGKVRVGFEAERKVQITRSDAVQRGPSYGGTDETA